MNMVTTKFYFLSTEIMNDLMTSSTTSPDEKNDAFYTWFNHEIDIGEMTEDGIKEQHVDLIVENSTTWTGTSKVSTSF